MLTQTAENPVVTEETAATPVVLTEVTKRYGRRRGAVAALDQVSLSFGAGSFTAVLGVSGSGKSTLLQCAAGLERPSAGTVHLCGEQLSRLSQRRRRVLRLLGRVGATRRQAAAVFGWQAVFVIATGLVAGVAAGTVTLLTVTRAATWSLTPYIPLGPAAGLVAAVVVLTAGAVMIPFWAMRRREPSLAAP